MRQNGTGTVTLEDARTWIEETGFCLFVPRRQYSLSIAPSFVEAVAGQRNATPDPKHIALTEELLVRLETDSVAVRLNLLGQVGEQPDFVVAAWVLPYVYALRGDRDWRRSPQLTGSRQVSQLAVQTYKQLELGDATVAELKHALGREVTEAAVLRAITELWQQLRIIPVVSAPGKAAKWQLLRTRYQKAIAEGASTSQVTAISVLASIYLQAVIAASMEEVELFLAPLTARSKVREVLRGLVATRQVHTISLGHAPHFYVAGTLPEFAVPPTAYSSSSMPASAYFMRSFEHEEEFHEPVAQIPPVTTSPVTTPAPAPIAAETAIPREAVSQEPAELHVPRSTPARTPLAAGKPAAARPHFSRPVPHSRDRKPAQSSSGSRPVRHSASDSRPASGTRWSASAPKNGNGSSNGKHTSAHGPVNGARPAAGSSARPAARPSGPSNGSRTAKPAAAAWGNRNGHSNGTKPAGKVGSTARNDSAPRKDSRPDAHPVRSSHKPTLAAGAKTGSSRRVGFTARPKQGTKKRG
jgi:hypothetical protein